MSHNRPRVGLFLPYWSFWETSAGGRAFLAERQETLREAEEVLSSIGSDVVISGLVDSVSSGEQFSISTADAGVQAIVVSNMLASIPHGTYAEVFHPDRDPTFRNLIANPPPIVDGV